MWRALLLLAAAPIGGALGETVAEQTSRCKAAPVPCDPNAERVIGAHANDRQIGYYCRCNLGFVGNGFTCYRQLSAPAHVEAMADLGERLAALRRYMRGKHEECAAVAADTMATENEQGEVECRCYTGTAWDEASAACVDIDECATCTHYCDYRARCVNGAGSENDYPYRCECMDGYVGNHYHDVKHQCIRQSVRLFF